MWVFTRSGFYSVVAYDPKKDLAKGSVFKRLAKNKATHVLVRARVKNDLEALRSVVPNVVIVEDKSADYFFRSVISRRAWKKFLNAATDDINYDSHFKEVMRDGDPDKDMSTKRYSAVMSVWSAMNVLQPYIPWSGYSTITGKSYGGSNWSKSALDDEEAWWAEHGDNYPADVDAPDEEVAPEDDTPLTLDDVKRFILEDNKNYTDFLSEKEIARATEEGFELWVRVVELRKKLGVANFHLSDILLEDLIADIQAKSTEGEEALN